MSVQKFGPTEIGNHPDLVKSAQEYFSTMDTFLCGRCLHKFHFIEAFKQHIANSCELNPLHYKRNANVTEFQLWKEAQLNNNSLDNAANANIWAFLLWKSAQLNSNEVMESTLWCHYQNWVKLDADVREEWIVAAKKIQPQPLVQ